MPPGIRWLILLLPLDANGGRPPFDTLLRISHGFSESGNMCPCSHKRHGERHTEANNKTEHSNERVNPSIGGRVCVCVCSSSRGRKLRWPSSSQFIFCWRFKWRAFLHINDTYTQKCSLQWCIPRWPFQVQYPIHRSVPRLLFTFWFLQFSCVCVKPSSDMLQQQIRV